MIDLLINFPSKYNKHMQKKIQLKHKSLKIHTFLASLLFSLSFDSGLKELPLLTVPPLCDRSSSVPR